MKRIALLSAVLLCLLLLWPENIHALPHEVEELLPEKVSEILNGTKEGDTNISLLSEGLLTLWENGCTAGRELLHDHLSGAVFLLCAILLCALLEDCSSAASNGAMGAMVPMVGVVVVTMIATGDVGTLMGQGTAVIESLHVLSKTLLPTLLAAVAAVGGAVSAGVRHVAAVFFADVLISVIRDYLLPLVYIYIALIAADVALPKRRFDLMANLMKKGITWFLSGFLLLYTGYLTLAGAMASASDALGVQLARSAMGAVPVVGGIISNAAATVLGGAGILKNTVGIAGMLAVLALCLVPFLTLALQFLIYRVTAFLAGTLGAEALTKLLDGFGSAFGLILGMTGACAVMLLISMISAVMVVTI